MPTRNLLEISLPGSAPFTCMNSFGRISGRLISSSIIACLSLVSLGCKASDAMIALDDIVTFTAAALPYVTTLSPQTASWLKEVPATVQVVSDLINTSNSNPLAKSSQVITDLQTLLDSAPVSNTLPTRDLQYVNDVCTAIRAFLNNYQAMVATSPSSTATIASSRQIRPLSTLTSADRTRLQAIKKHAVAVQNQLSSSIYR